MEKLTKFEDLREETKKMVEKEIRTEYLKFCEEFKEEPIANNVEKVSIDKIDKHMFHIINMKIKEKFKNLLLSIDNLDKRRCIKLAITALYDQHIFIEQDVFDLFAMCKSKKDIKYIYEQLGGNRFLLDLKQ